MEVAVLAAAVAVTTSPETFAAASDPDAGIRVAALYEAHARTIVGLCRFLLRDPVEAEDAAQQSFLSAYRSLLGGAVPREPAAWLAAIARNECWTRIRRRMREPLTLHEIPADQADPMELAARNADLAALRAGLEELSGPQREAFLLREFTGLTYRELSAALGVTESAVDSLLFRARTHLRRVLQAANGFLAPVALRDQLARLIPGFEQPAVGTVAKLASLPIAAKLAAAGAGAVLVVAGSAGLDRHPLPPFVADAVAAPRHAIAARPVPRPAAPAVRALPIRIRATAAPVVLLVPRRVAPRPAAPATSTRVGDTEIDTPDATDRSRDQSATADPAADDPGIIPPGGGGGGFTSAEGPSDNGPSVVGGGDAAGGPEAESGSSGSADGKSASGGSGSGDSSGSGDVKDSGGSDGGGSPGDSGGTTTS